MSIPSHQDASFAPTFTSFVGYSRMAAGSLHTNAFAVKAARERGATEPIVVFDDASGRTVDVDTRGTDADMLERLASAAAQGDATANPHSAAESAEPAEPRGRGRPKLGVVAREVTLLPRHWEWLAAQPGGASVALRKLVEDARRASSLKDRQRKAQERAYHFMQTIAGDLAGFEEATRALFAGDPQRLSACMADWPADVRDHALLLALV